MIRLLACAIAVFSFVEIAQAGRPIETDDASAAGHKTCQLDFWTETGRETRQDNFNGGCNFFGQGEFSLSLGDVSGEVSGNQADQELYAFGYKHILQNVSEAQAGYGLAVGREWGRLKASGELSKETLIAGVSSIPLTGEDLLLHLNLGYLQYSDQTLEDTSIFKAAALDYSFNERLGLSVETFSGVEDSLSWRLGVRYVLLPDFLQIDASYGSDYGMYSDGKVFTVGFGINPGF